jgi:hypothetical protein
MTIKRPDSERFSLARWSRRKLESHAQSAPIAKPVPVAKPASAAPAGIAAPSSIAGAAAPLPPVESLTFDSDFTAFLRPEVDPKLQRAALKQLFRHPRFNVMDGLDVYIDDYTKADPIPPDMLAGLLDRFDAANAAPQALDSGETEAARGPVQLAANPMAAEGAVDSYTSPALGPGEPAGGDALATPRAGESATPHADECATPPEEPSARDARSARLAPNDTGPKPARNERR